MKKTGDGRRVQRVEKEVQQVLSRFLMGTFKGDLPGIVTVTKVVMPADLRSARVFVSVLNGEAQQHERAAEMLQERASEMQRYLADNLPLRYTPKLRFEADLSLEKVLKVDRILHDLAKSKPPEESED
jgi:ribosome-binding factor A